MPRSARRADGEVSGLEGQAPGKAHVLEVRYLIGDGEGFDWGVDYVSCGNYEFMKQQGAEEFAPYVCLSDMALGEALGWGLTRTQTLADGCDRCDFRFKQGGGTHISSQTRGVQKTIERIRGEERIA